MPFIRSNVPILQLKISKLNYGFWTYHYLKVISFSSNLYQNSKIHTLNLKQSSSGNIVNKKIKDILAQLFFF